MLVNVTGQTGVTVLQFSLTETSVSFNKQHNEGKKEISNVNKEL